MMTMRSWCRNSEAHGKAGREGGRHPAPRIGGRRLGAAPKSSAAQKSNVVLDYCCGTVAVSGAVCLAPLWHGRGGAAV